MMDQIELREAGTARYEIARTGAMRVPGVIFASPDLLPEDEQTLRQVANVATLPGIVEASYAMPDLHQGYGFPIGGVAATDVDAGGVVSPGGVGFDISCGVRMLTAPLTLHEAGADGVRRLMDRLDRSIPRGSGPGGIWEDMDNLERILTEGPVAAIAAGYGTEADLERTEDHGRLAEADPRGVSEKARARGSRQVGSLGGGNHFLEVQVVDGVVDPAVAQAFGIDDGQLVVTIHTGSRGLGHQVCTEHVRAMQSAMTRYGIELPDRQLACAPIDAPEGQAYLGAMAAAANYGRANRQVLAEAARDAFAEELGSRDLRLLYDVSHNLAKIETHAVDGRPRRLCVHRKGATRAFDGQPVIVPGSMGTASWLLVGAGGPAFASTCHGAGRARSRAGARRMVSGEDVRRELESRGIAVRARSTPELAEEAPLAYKDVDEVVRVCEAAGLSRRVARLRPVGVVKG